MRSIGYSFAVYELDFDTVKYVVVQKSHRTLVVVHGAKAPTNDDWFAVLEWVRAGDFENIFVDSVGGAPSLLQARSLLTVLASQKEKSMVLLTSSKTAIAALKAIELMRGKSLLNAFRSFELSKAIAFLGLSKEEAEALKKVRLALRALFF